MATQTVHLISMFVGTLHRDVVPKLGVFRTCIVQERGRSSLTEFKRVAALHLNIVSTHVVVDEKRTEASQSFSMTLSTPGKDPGTDKVSSTILSSCSSLIEVVCACHGCTHLNASSNYIGAARGAHRSAASLSHTRRNLSYCTAPHCISCLSCDHKHECTPPHDCIGY